MAYIEFDRKKSTDFDLYLTNDMEHESASQDVQQVTVPGRDGVLLISNNRLNPVQKAFPFRIKTRKNLTQVSEQVSAWLNVPGYKELKLSWDPDYIYKAAFVETFSISEIMRQFGDIRLNFLVHPIKYFVGYDSVFSVTKGREFDVKGNVKALPIIKIQGSGSMALEINGRRTRLKDIQNQIVLDMQARQVYSGRLPAWDKVVRGQGYEMPYLDPGKNRINWDGNFTVTIVPNWGVKI